MLIVWLVSVLFVGAQETKIDPKVSQAIRGGRSTGVILLGKRQLLEGPKGFPEFCAKHKGAKRRSGHICFCGHGASVKFKNITIKELPATKP